MGSLKDRLFTVSSDVGYQAHNTLLGVLLWGLMCGPQHPSVVVAAEPGSRHQPPLLPRTSVLGTDVEV